MGAYNIMVEDHKDNIFQQREEAEDSRKKGNIERWITEVTNKAWTKCADMCMKGCSTWKCKLRSMLQGSKSIK
eukprot:14483230-Heterocapsa_arctica.AAC.1